MKQLDIVSTMQLTAIHAFIMKEFFHSLSINGSNITSGHMTDGCSNTVRYLEHVQARVVFQTIKRGVLEIFLTSPSGLESQLLTSRPYDRERKKLDWTFMTVHHWGEDPTGEWQLRVQTTEPDLGKCLIK